MTEMQEGLSTKFPLGEWDQVLAYLAKRENKAPKSQESYESLKKVVIQRDKCCQYKSKVSNKTCGSKWNLQPDHIKPLWAGGEDTLENLRAMCGNHNRQIYREQTNTRRI
jgi:5-methylcytosine-specific restriction endonuclease McrA